MISRNIQVKLLLMTFLLLLFTNLSAQLHISSNSENQQTNTITDNSMVTSDSVLLLPDKYLFTQRLFWGKRGLMRNFNSFKLSETEREREMNIRYTMISAHEYMGYTTLAGMACEGITGILLYNGHKNLEGLHGSLAGVVDLTYLATAGLALFAPPPMNNMTKGWNSLRIHKILSLFSLSSLIATDVLGGLSKNNPDLVPYHRAAAYTAFGSMLVSTIIIKF